MYEKDLKKFISKSLIEDIGDGDHTSNACIPDNNFKKAKIFIKSNGIIAGIEMAKMIFYQIDPKIEFNIYKNDGENVIYGDTAITISGNAKSILKGERLVLNCMQRMSSIATKTKHLTEIIKDTDVKILDTRKTTPLNRIIEKWAVTIGNGHNHRFGLYDMIMIKDNHIDFCGGITNAIIKTKKYLKENNKSLDIIVEARNISEVKEILKNAGVKRILLDNFNYKDTRLAVKIIGDQCQTESSGNISEKTILKYAECGVNYISIGSLTNIIEKFDISLEAI